MAFFRSQGMMGGAFIQLEMPLTDAEAHLQPDEGQPEKGRERP